MRILYLSMKLVSQGAQYAISAIIALSKKEYGKAVSAADLAKALDCPAAYLSQLLSKLKKPGILKSQRGLNGGVLLAKPVKEISIYDVIVAIDGDSFFNNCFMGIEGCGHIEPCPFHNFWSNQRQKIKKWLIDTNFEDAEKAMSQVWFEQQLNFTS
ncbi:MAG TPA: Rrf2 family transcriptional regulator [Balneola sp.]|nr:Rrf2 family transcriptional regulator [Bacteroidota bacterium]HCT52869.1 Rrf2 family transcriptional regulator [Balneola sp.]